MPKIPIILLAIIIMVAAGCMFTKGHYTKDGSMWVWNKDPNGQYNAHNPLKIDAANKWVDSVMKIPALRTLKLQVTSRRSDHYIVNDSIMFFDLKKQELPNYHSYHTFARRLQIDPELLRKTVMDFDKLGLNRFYREDEFIAFKTVAYMNYTSGYFYFFDLVKVNSLNAGDILHFKDSDFKYFTDANYDRFVVLKKYDNHWIEWEQF